jgi:hypothetical protein
MEEKIEKIIELSGNKNRFQYFLEIIIILYWINCNLLSVSLPYLENTSIVSYYDSEKNETIKESMNYDLCKMEKDETFEIVETYKYSWVIEQNLECDKVKTGLIGTIAFTGNMLGALSYPFVSKFFGQKKCLLIGTSLFIILLIICLFINEFWFYLITLIICNIGSNLMCYSTLTIAGEISAPKLRALFGSLTNFGFGAGGIFYIIMFWVLDSWKWVFIICAIFLFVLGIIVIIFFLESPRYVLQKNVDDFLDILRSIAKFNGRLEIFDKELKEQEFQEIINYLKIHNKELKDENESKIVSNKVNQKLTINFNENYNIQLPTESPNVVPIDKKNKKNQIENDSSLYSDLKNNLQNNLNKENDFNEENLQKHNKHETKGEKQLINLDDIISGKDTRTTIMIRNIPIKYSDKMLINELEEFKDKFDCIYMPYDQEKCGNKGYAFINFIHPYHILFFYEKFQNKTWNFFESKKICELNNANFQGISEIQKHAKNYKGIKKPTFFKGLDSVNNIEVPLKYLKKIKARYPMLNYVEKKEKNIFLIKSFN